MAVFPQPPNPFCVKVLGGRDPGSGGITMAAFSWSPDPLHISKPFVTTDSSAQPSYLISRTSFSRQGLSGAHGVCPPVHSTPWRAEEILGTISGVLKEPPGFAHLTQNKKLIGRLGFCSGFAFFSASSRGGGGGDLFC